MQIWPVTLPHRQSSEDENSYPVGLAFINPGAQLRDLIKNISDLGKIYTPVDFSLAQTLSSLLFS